MKKIVLTTLSATLLVLGAASAQAQYRGAYPNDGLVTAPVAGGYPIYGAFGREFNNPVERRSDTYNSRVFRSQEILPQSPPGGS